METKESLRLIKYDNLSYRIISLARITLQNGYYRQQRLTVCNGEISIFQNSLMWRGKIGSLTQTKLSSKYIKMLK